MKSRFWILCHLITAGPIMAAVLFSKLDPSRNPPPPAGTVVAMVAAGQTEDRSQWAERDWTRHMADQMGGQAEHRLPDGSRVDVLTETTAWEIDWAEKHPEAVGQALFYAISTNKRPGIVLLMRGDRAKAEENYLEALAVVAYLRGLGVDLQLATSDEF